MVQYFLEYIWLDGSYPQQLRSKTKIVASFSTKKGRFPDIETPNWNFDGSSTGQTETNRSELILVPVSKYIDPFRKNGILC